MWKRTTNNLHSHVTCAQKSLWAARQELLAAMRYTECREEMTTILGLADHLEALQIEIREFEEKTAKDGEKQ